MCGFNQSQMGKYFHCYLCVGLFIVHNKFAYFSLTTAPGIKESGISARIPITIILTRLVNFENSNCCKNNSLIACNCEIVAH